MEQDAPFLVLSDLVVNLSVFFGGGGFCSALSVIRGVFSILVVCREASRLSLAQIRR